MRLSRQATEAGFSLRHHAVIGSTNVAAIEAVADGADRLWVVADRQEAGRGRHGRAWESPPGNLYASLGLSAPCAPAEAPKLGFVAGLALAEAVLALAPVLAGRLSLKWPNDCLLDGGKCAGILLEGATLAGGRQGLAIGIGVNIAHSPAVLGRAAARLGAHAPALDPAGLFEALSARMAANLDLFGSGAGFASIRKGWLSHALPAGTAIIVRPPGGEKRGRFAGLDAAGNLLIDTQFGTERILAGDVFVAPAAPDPATAAGDAL